MNEGKEKSNQENLSEFSDYLAEFDLLVNFDSETCPVCGIDIPEYVPIQNPSFVLYKSIKQESDLLPIINELKQKEISFKVVRKLDTEVLNKVSYLFDILIPLTSLSVLDKAIKK